MVTVTEGATGRGRSCLRADAESRDEPPTTPKPPGAEPGLSCAAVLGAEPAPWPPSGLPAPRARTCLCRTPGVTRGGSSTWTPSRITSCCGRRGPRRACPCSSRGPSAPATPEITSSRWVAAGRGAGHRAGGQRPGASWSGEEAEKGPQRQLGVGDQAVWEPGSALGL